MRAFPLATLPTTCPVRWQQPLCARSLSGKWLTRGHAQSVPGPVQPHQRGRRGLRNRCTSPAPLMGRFTSQSSKDTIKDLKSANLVECAGISLLNPDLTF